MKKKAASADNGLKRLQEVLAAFTIGCQLRRRTDYLSASNTRDVISSIEPRPEIERYCGAFGRPIRRASCRSDERFGLVVVDLKALENDFFTVVVALNEIFARDVVLAFDLGRVVLDVIRAAARRMHATTGHAFDNFTVGHVDFKHEVDGDAASARACACGIVRGKPSKSAPFLQSGASRRSFTRPRMISSETSCPFPSQPWQPDRAGCRP